MDVASIVTTPAGGDAVELLLEGKKAKKSKIYVRYVVTDPFDPAYDHTISPDANIAEVKATEAKAAEAKEAEAKAAAAAEAKETIGSKEWAAANATAATPGVAVEAGPSSSSEGGGGTAVGAAGGVCVETPETDAVDGKAGGKTGDATAETKTGGASSEGTSYNAVGKPSDNQEGEGGERDEDEGKTEGRIQGSSAVTGGAPQFTNLAAVMVGAKVASSAPPPKTVARKKWAKVAVAAKVIAATAAMKKPPKRTLCTSQLDIIDVASTEVLLEGMDSAAYRTGSTHAIPFDASSGDQSLRSLHECILSLSEGTESFVAPVAKKKKNIMSKFKVVARLPGFMRSKKTKEADAAVEAEEAEAAKTDGAGGVAGGKDGDGGNSSSSSTGNATVAPFRCSSLTRFLDGKLGGDANALALFCCGSSNVEFHNSMASVRWATRFQKIVQVRGEDDSCFSVRLVSVTFVCVCGGGGRYVYVRTCPCDCYIANH